MTRAPDEDLLLAALERLERRDLERLKRLTPEELAAELAEQGHEEDAGRSVARLALERSEEQRLERVKALGPEELAAELAEHGLSPDDGFAIAESALRAHGAPGKPALRLAPEPAPQTSVASKESATPSPNVIPIASRRAARLAFSFSFAAVAAAAAIVVVEGPALVAYLEDAGRTTVSSAFDGGPDDERLRDLEESAFFDDDAGRYADCLRKLDEAARIRPSILGMPEVERHRLHATVELARQAGASDGGPG